MSRRNIGDISRFFDDAFEKSGIVLRIQQGKPTAAATAFE